MLANLGDKMEAKQLSLLEQFKKWFLASDFEQLNEQSYIRLCSSFENIDNKDKADLKTIKLQLEKLDKYPDWNTVKLLELLLIPFLNEYDLEIDLHHQLHKAKNLFRDNDYAFFIKEFEAIAKNSDIELPNSSSPNKEKVKKEVAAKRALLNKLTASLHKYYEDRQLRSLFANKARWKIGVFFTLSIFFSVFLLAIGILHPDGVYQYCVRYCPESDWLNSITMGLFEETDTQKADKIHLHYAITALMAGGMGSCFSMLISLKNRIETVTLQELNNIHSWHFILTRIITGVGAALICYYFFRADLLSGSLFPDFGKGEEISLSSKSFFTLIIWCFIAGFSEKLVPSILSKTEAQVDKNKH